MILSGRHTDAYTSADRAAFPNGRACANSGQLLLLLKPNAFNGIETGKML